MPQPSSQNEVVDLIPHVHELFAIARNIRNFQHYVDTTPIWEGEEGSWTSPNEIAVYQTEWDLALAKKKFQEKCIETKEQTFSSVTISDSAAFLHTVTLMREDIDTLKLLNQILPEQTKCEFYNVILGRIEAPYSTFCNQYEDASRPPILGMLYSMVGAPQDPLYATLRTLIGSDEEFDQEFLE